MLLGLLLFFATITKEVSSIVFFNIVLNLEIQVAKTFLSNQVTAPLPHSHFARGPPYFTFIFFHRECVCCPSSQQSYSFKLSLRVTCVLSLCWSSNSYSPISTSCGGCASSIQGSMQSSNSSFECGLCNAGVHTATNM